MFLVTKFLKYGDVIGTIKLEEIIVETIYEVAFWLFLIRIIQFSI